MTNGNRSRWPHLASRADILQWAKDMESRSEFPRLVRTLIRQTNDQVVTLQMRAAEGVGLPGYDGDVEASRATPFVPSGKSVWELGTGGDPQSKANEDYKKRTEEDALGADLASTTFVFVTLQEWGDKQDWASKKKKERRWLDVRVLDVDDIELAFEEAPAAHFWFSEVIGKPASGVRTVEDWWQRFSALSNPQLSARMVLEGRADEAADLLRRVELDRQTISVSAVSTDDVLCFVAATFLSAPHDVSVDLLARTLIVLDTLALRQLDSASGLLILLPFEEDLRREAQLVTSHHVIFLAPLESRSTITLPSIAKSGFASQLQGLGVSEALAAELSSAAARSILAFQRKAPSSGAPLAPEWFKLLGSSVVRRSCLAGGWTERRSGDLDALSLFLEVPWGQARTELVEAASGADPLLALDGDTWSVVSPRDAWDNSPAKYLAGDLPGLEALVQTVLAAVDPTLELLPEDRWKASLFGKTRVHSSNLREGVARTLAMLGTFGDVVNIGSGRTAVNWAESIVWTLLDRANRDIGGQLWASLAEVLPLLAEAAPDVFLGAVQRGVDGNEPVLLTMFIDQGDALSVSSPHTGLLWALEALAWSPEYLGMVTDLLARLAEIDPGGRLSNRPENSLVDIFRPWIPQTSASADARLVVLDGLTARREDAGWRLLLGLLPEHHAVGNFTHKPIFRDWAAGEGDD